MGAAEVEELVEAWRAAGLLTPEQAEAIRAHEEQRILPAVPEPHGVPPRRALAAEAVGYVGSAFALGALILLLSDAWGGLTPVARTTVAGLSTVALLGSGIAVRRLHVAAMQRLTSVLWTGAVGALGWTVGLIGFEWFDLVNEPLAMLVTGAMLLLAVPLYLLRSRLLLQGALLASVVAFATSTVLVLSPLPPSARWIGTGIVGLGLTWALLGVGGWLRPAVVAEAAGAVLVLIGTQAISAEEPRWIGLALGIAFAASLVTIAVRTDTRHPLFLGAFALFVLTPQLVFELFADTIGAPASLLVVGLLLVLLAVGLIRARRGIHVAEEAPHER